MHQNHKIAGNDQNELHVIIFEYEQQKHTFQKIWRNSVTNNFVIVELLWWVRPIQIDVSY